MELELDVEPGEVKVDDDELLGGIGLSREDVPTPVVPKPVPVKPVPGLRLDEGVVVGFLVPVELPVETPVAVEAAPVLGETAPPPAPYSPFVERSSRVIALAGTPWSPMRSMRSTLWNGVRDSCDAQPTTRAARDTMPKKTFMPQSRLHRPGDKWGLDLRGCQAYDV